MNLLKAFHHQLFFWLNSIRGESHLVDVVIYLFANVVDTFVFLLGIFLSFCFFTQWKWQKKEIVSWHYLYHALFILGSLGVAWVITAIIKNFAALPRPFLRFEEFIPLFHYGGFNSFPSGHATVFSALATLLFIQHKPTGIMFFILALCIAGSRVISGIHFPIDIIGGGIIGCFSTVLIWYLFYRH